MAGTGLGNEGAYFEGCRADPDCRFCSPGSAKRPSDPWWFLDAVYCISLQERDDRTQAANRELHRVGLCRKALFYRPRKHHDGPWRGIWYSHRDVARHALARRESRVLVLEDDIHFSRFLSPRRIGAVGRAIASLPRDWRIFYLGHWPVRARLLRHNLVQTISACTHAYVAGPLLLDWLQASEPERMEHEYTGSIGRGLDAAFAQIPGAYAYFPMLAVQTTSPADHLRTTRPRKLRRLRHLVTRTRAREYLMSVFMRPNELLVVSWFSTVAALSALVRALARFAET